MMTPVLSACCAPNHSQGSLLRFFWLICTYDDIIISALPVQNDSQGPGNETILTCLAELFIAITHQKRRTGVFAPRKFVTRLRKENGVWPSRRIASCWAHNPEVEDRVLLLLFLFLNYVWPGVWLVGVSPVALLIGACGCTWT
jgi:hypothetical protein